MVKYFTIMETREMSEHQLQMEIRKCAKQIESLGMEHEDACALVSSIMNLSIAIQEKNQNRTSK